MRLHCPKCASEIAAVDINIRELVGKCSQCDNVFAFQGADREIYSRAKQVAQPGRIRRKVVGETLHLSWDWSTAWAIPALVGAVLLIWLCFTLDFNFASLICVIAGLWVSYWALTRWTNSTEIVIDDEIIRVTHGPLLWSPSQAFSTMHARQFYAGNYHTGRYNTEYFALNMIKHSATHVRVVEGLGSAEHAYYLEQQIEAFLGIVDMPVRGEI